MILKYFRTGFDESRGLHSGKRQKSMLDLSKRQGELEGRRNHFTQQSMLDLSSSAPLGTKAGGHRQSMVDLRPHPATSSDPRQRFSVASSGLSEQLPPHLRHYLVSDKET